MKKYMRFMLSLMLCAGFLQPTLQAVPSETCAKWVARGATLIYWNFLMGPAFDKALGAMNLRVARSHIDERACDLQDIAPESYAEIQNILRQEGLPGLDGYTIKKAPKIHPDANGHILGVKLSLRHRMLLYPVTNMKRAMHHLHRPQRFLSIKVSGLK